jgi:DUF971 family protein
MVICVLGEEPDSYDERDRVGKRRKFERLHDGVAVAFPARKTLQSRIDVGVGESRHASIEPQTTSTRHTRVMPMDIPDVEPPTEVELDRTVGLTVRWPDGAVARFDLEDLRRNCPCAECRGKREQGLAIWPAPGAPQPLEATGAELVGHWGLSIRWNDGHETGIYAWSILHAWAGLDTE